MSAYPHSLGHRVMATGVAAALALTSVVTTMGVAHAEETRPEYGNINTAQDGSLTLHKRESGSQGSVIGSVFSETAGGVPVQGAGFTYYKVSGLDLTQPADWEKLAGINVPVDACTAAAQSDQLQRKLGQYNLAEGVGFPAQTDREGKTTAQSLKTGAYLICETHRPAHVKKEAAPFLVTIPYFDAKKGWVYDVHAYPKNTVIQPGSKTVAPVTEYGIQRNDQVTFQIKAKIPSLSKATVGTNSKNEYFKYFVIGDSMVDAYSEGKITSVQLANDEQGAGAQEIDGGKYTKVDSATPSNQTPHWLSVTFKKEGLTELRNNPNKYVIVTIKAKVKSLGTSGTLSNTGYVMVDTITHEGPDDPEPENPGYNPPTTGGTPPTSTGGPDPFTPTNKVVTVWGQAKLKKHSKDAQQTGLDGAQFKIYHAETQDEACTGKAIDPQKSEPVNVNGETVFTSKAGGIVTVDGLFIDQAEGVAGREPAPQKQHRCYVFEEVQAPLGYILPKGEAARIGVKVTPGSSDQPDVSFENTQVSVPELPITGASGTVIATVVGTSLLLLAVGAVLVRRRREVEKTH